MQPIDAVVTWVDGSDPAHIKKRRIAERNVAKDHSTTILAGLDGTRFADNHEIAYCLASIRRFAPWIRTVFLVTDKQIPKFLSNRKIQELGITLVDHKEIFSDFEWALPTFNSLSIESVLWRTPGLAERFIYFNDDFFLTDKVYPEDFFLGDRVVLRGEWKSIQSYGKLRWTLSRSANFAAKRLFGINRSMSVLQQMRGATLAGAKRKFFKVAHTPYPLRRETFERFFSTNRKTLEENIKYAFRDSSQYAPTSLANHIEILQNNAELRNDESLMICFNRDSQNGINKKLDIIKKGNLRFLCVQSLEQAKRSEKENMLEALKQITDTH